MEIIFEALCIIYLLNFLTNVFKSLNSIEKFVKPVMGNISYIMCPMNQKDCLLI